MLRVGDLTDSDMIARRVAMLEEVTCAAPNYLDRAGTPLSIDALAGHRMVGFHSSGTGGLLPLEFTVDGTIHKVALPATVSVNGAESVVAAARLGLGLRCRATTLRTILGAARSFMCSQTIRHRRRQCRCSIRATGSCRPGCAFSSIG